jgi:hypothetical protein
MARRKRRKSGCDNAVVDSALPPANTPEKSKRPVGWCAAESVDAMLPWRSDLEGGTQS